MPVSPAKEPIALIGIGCRFPGGVKNPQAFWQFLMDGRDAIGEIPADRFDLSAWYDARPAIPGRIASRWGGFLDEIDGLDAACFEMSPREAERLDPQQRLLMETAWEALEDAGLVADEAKLADTGVFIGAWLNDFEARLFHDPALVDFHTTTGSGRYALSGRLSHFFGFHGPSLTVDAACASSLTAVALAVESLQSGRCSLALAGGVNVILQPHITIAYSQSNMMAPDGRCKFGDAAANGYVRSEGAGVVVLKPLSAALADGDPIYALIVGSALNNDGRSGRSLGTPGQAGQEDLLRKAYADAGIDPNQVYYVEAHGTGTLRGDPVELSALAQVLGQGRAKNQALRVGSVKTNFGHTEGAAGIAGLIKAALALKNRALPASLHYHTPNPNLDWESTPVTIQAEAEPWPEGEGPRFAGVSAFGIAGSNAHVVLQEACPAPPIPAEEKALMRPAVLPLSARSPEALQALAKDWEGFLATLQPGELAGVLYSAACRRGHHPYRLTAAGDSLAELRQNLPVSAEGTPEPVTDAPKLAFVFPGQGGQWPGMGRDLYRSEPVFREAFERCEAAMRPYLDRPLVEALFAEDGPGRLDPIDVIQPVLFAVQAALAGLWRSWGVMPEAVIGHSMGEVAAAYTAGILTLEEAAQVICLRSRLMQPFNGQGAMLLAGLSLEEAGGWAQPYAGRLSTAVSNGPHTTVLSGDPDAVQELAARLTAENVFCRILKVDVAAHSPQMEGPAAELVRRLTGLQPQAGRVPFYSTVTGSPLAGTAAGPDYWGRNLRNPVRFSEAAAQAMADGYRVFLELSPHPTLINALADIASHPTSAGVQAAAIASLQRNEDGQRALAGALGELYRKGVPIDWGKVYPGGSFVRLPAYPWQRKRYWLASALPDARSSVGAEARIPGRASRLADGSGIITFDLKFDPNHRPWLKDYLAGRQAILPPSVLLDLLRQAAREAYGGPQVSLRDIQLLRPIFMPDDGSALEFQTIFRSQGREDIFQVYLQEAGSWRLYATAALAKTGEPPTPETGGEFQLPSGDGQPGEDLYAVLEKSGIRPGVLFRNIEAYWQEDTRLVARIAADAAPDLILEDALAAGLAFAGSLSGIPEGRAALFEQAGAYMEMGDLREASWVEALAGGIGLYDRQGRLLARLLAPSWRVEMPDGPGPPGSWLYANEWLEPAPVTGRPTGPSPVSPAEREAGAWLIFCDRQGVGESLAESLEGRGLVCMRAASGPAFHTVGERKWQLPANSAEGFQALLKQAAGDRAEKSLQGIVYCWGLDVPPDRTPDEIGDEPLILPVLHLIRSLNALQVEGRMPIWLITRGSQAQPGQAAAAPLQAALWGLGQVIANEHPEWWGGLIDLDPDLPAQQSAGQLAEELFRSGSSQRALRKGIALERSLKNYRLDPGDTTAYRWDPGGAYLITGGLGGVGLAAARWMAGRGARRLILLGRTRLPERGRWAQVAADDPLRQRIDALLEIEASGAQVLLAGVDLTQPGELAAWLEAYWRQGGRPIRGVLHAAVQNEDRLLADLEASSLKRTFSAKAQGALELAAQLPELDFLIFFSSVIALFGPAGTGSYASANAYLDGLSGALQGFGSHVLNINWSAWENLGLARADHIDQTVQNFKAQGIRSFSALEGFEVLGQLIDQLTGGKTLPASLAVIPFDARTYRQVQGPRFGEELFARLLQIEERQESQTEVADSYASRLERAPREERCKLLAMSLEQITRRVFHLTSEAVDLHRPLGLMGMDSLMGVELRNQIQSLLGIKLPVTFVWNYPTLDAMAGRLCDLLEGEPQADSPETQPARPVSEPQLEMQAVLDQVNSLSDEEAFQKLIGSG